MENLAIIFAIVACFAHLANSQYPYPNYESSINSLEEKPFFYWNKLAPKRSIGGRYQGSDPFSFGPRAKPSVSPDSGDDLPSSDPRIDLAQLDNELALFRAKFGRLDAMNPDPTERRNRKGQRRHVLLRSD